MTASPLINPISLTQPATRATRSCLANTVSIARRELRDALRGAVVGTPPEASYENQHGDHSHKVRLAITPKSIEKLQLPAFDEELVKKITRDKVSSPDEFKASMRADIERYWNERSEAKVADDIASEIVRTHEVTVPDAFTEALLDSFVEEVRERSRDKALPRLSLIHISEPTRPY